MRLAVALLLLVGCSKPNAPNVSVPAAPSPPAPAGGAGSIAGHVRFSGAPPADVERPSKLAFPECSRFGMPDATLKVSKEDGVADAFVWIVSGLPDGSYPMPSTPVVLDQRGCEFAPRVFGVRVGQPVKLRNSDPFLHNAHAFAGGFNVPMPTQGSETVRRFEHAAVPAIVGCDVHGWMRAYAGVVDNPFFAVTDGNGAFELSGLPDGHYGVGVWQERFGRQLLAVDVRGGALATVDVQLQRSN